MDYSQVGVIKQAIVYHCNYLIHDHIRIQGPHPNWNNRMVSYWLGKANPEFYDVERSKILRKILTDIPGKLRAAVLATNITNNYIFLARLSIQRDWKLDCPICLGEEIISRENYYNHIIMIPCGHSMCRNGCFDKFSKMGHTDCPICRQKIVNTFETRDVHMGKEFYESFVTDDLVLEVRYL